MTRSDVARHNGMRQRKKCCLVKCLFVFVSVLFSFCNYSRHYFDLMDTRLQIFPAKSEATISINQIIHGEGGKEQHPVR